MIIIHHMSGEQVDDLGKAPMKITSYAWIALAWSVHLKVNLI